MKQMTADFIAANLMGPNSVAILDELAPKLPLKPGMKVLDLACGRGLTSIYLAQKFGVNVFAFDLWIDASDNWHRFKQMEVDDLIIPLHGDALDLPFADSFFDAIISIDSYHYFGNNDTYFSQKIKPLLKEDGYLALAFPGMKYELHDDVPEQMKPFWPEESLAMWHSIDWWRPKFESELKNFEIGEMACFSQAWADWLSTDNLYAKDDKPMMAADNGRYMNIIGLCGQV